MTMHGAWHTQWNGSRPRPGPTEKVDCEPLEKAARISKFTVWVLIFAYFKYNNTFFK